MSQIIQNLKHLNKDEIIQSINVKELLPPKLAIPNAGEHFYKYGLIFYTHTNIKQKVYYNPYFIWIVELIYFTRSLVSLFVSESNRQYFVYSGDYMYFIRAKTHINIAATQYMMLGISILAMNFLNYQRNIEPSFIKTFDFLSGKVSPSKAGLYNRRYIFDIVNKSRRAIKLTELNTKVVFCVSFVLSFLPTFLNFDYMESILFAFPWSLLFAISSYYTFSSYFWNMTYFYILCHYIKFRIRETNDTAIKVLTIGRVKRCHLAQLQRQYAAIDKEVHIYNNTYWSKYLFIVIVLLSTFNNTVFYTALFVDMNIVVKVSLVYATMLSSSAIFFLLNTASVVYHEANKSRGIFYKIAQKMLDIKSTVKISSIIDTLGARKIGFKFSNLFVINYFRFYEIFSLLIGYFLKIVELSRGNDQ